MIAAPSFVSGAYSAMRLLGRAIVVVAPLLLAACGSDSEQPAGGGTPVVAAPTQAQTAQPTMPSDTAPSVPLRQTPEGLLGSTAGSTPALTDAPAASAAPTTPPQEPAEDAPASEAEVRGLYEDIMYTYAFDACGLPLIGQAARQDIEQRIEVCPNPPLRKDAFRTVYHRAIEVAQEDPEKVRASAGRACPDKREFLRRVMSHAGDLQFDSTRPTECSLLSPPGTAPANSAAGAHEPAGAQKPF
jgi:hypothetical protein